MTDPQHQTRPEDERLSPSDAALVAGIADAMHPPARSASQRVAFGAALEERIARQPRSTRARWLAGACTAAALGLALAWLPGRAPVEIAEAPVPVTATPVEAMLSLVEEELPDADAALPDDYQAIAGLFLAGS